MSVLFGSTPKPTLPAVVKAPDEKDPAVLEAKKKKVAQQQAAQGRESTFLEQPAAYSGKALGS